MTIAERWMRFQEEMDDTASHYGRRTSEIQVMAVSKTRSIQEIHNARAAGLTSFGENRVEEALMKFVDLDMNDYPLSLIGHLQSNKIRKIDHCFAGVHSVDSYALAVKLSQHREHLQAPLDVLIQVNTSGEESKSGYGDRDEFIDAAQGMSKLPFLRLRGVMTMAPFIDDEMIVRRCFSRCREWSEYIRDDVDGGLTLSMGMSSDYRWAIAEGSTLLRIGTILFGEGY